MGLEVNRTNAIEQLIEMNVALQNSAMGIYQASIDIEAFINSPALQGAVYDSFRAHYTQLHDPVLKGILCYIDEMMAANINYRNRMDSLKGDYLNEDALQAQIAQAQKLVTFAESLPLAPLFSVLLIPLGRQVEDSLQAKLDSLYHFASSSKDIYSPATFMLDYVKKGIAFIEATTCNPTDGTFTYPSGSDYDMTWAYSLNAFWNDKQTFGMEALVFMDGDTDKLFVEFLYRQLLTCDDPARRKMLLRALKNQMTKEDAMSMVYNVDGEYGGSQGSPAKRFRTDPDFQKYMYALLPGKSKDEIINYLDTYNSVGCGYMAMANTIFVEYANKPDEFEMTFGFPLYRCDSRGNVRYNFDYLVTDLYNSSGTIGIGTSNLGRKLILEKYLRSKGLKVTITSRFLNVTCIEDALQTGQVILRQHPVKLYHMDGSVGANDTDGSHAIVVTGVTGDGNLIVSSWGGQYIVKPSDYPGFDLSDISTWMTYLDCEVLKYG